MRWMVSDRYVLAASEVGICPSVEAGAYKTAQLEPGQTIRYRIKNDELLEEKDVIKKLSEKNPYKEWVKSKPLKVDVEFNDLGDEGIDQEKLGNFFEYTPEEERLILQPMIKGETPTGSMGNDSPLAILSKNNPRLTRYFHQMFAQVTNPPIDPIRERLVMSTKSYLGKRGSILKETAQQASLIDLKSPILSKGIYDKLISKDFTGKKSKEFNTTFNKSEKNLEEFLDNLCKEVELAITDKKKSIIIFTDRNIKEGDSVATSLLVVGLIHHYLIEKGIRLKASLVMVSGEVRDAHDLACHISYGSSAVWPYLALEKSRLLAVNNPELEITPSEAQENYRDALNNGLLKIMSKMGICTVASYRGSELFEIIGLNKKLVEKSFKFSKIRTEGIGLEELNDILAIY